MVDYYGRWKAAMYAIRKVYHSVAVFVKDCKNREEGGEGGFEVVVVNDCGDDVEGLVGVVVTDF